jgi:hypothetical protein
VTEKEEGMRQEVWRQLLSLREYPRRTLSRAHPSSFFSSTLSFFYVVMTRDVSVTVTVMTLVVQALAQLHLSNALFQQLLRRS